MVAASKSKWLRIQTGDHLTPFYSEEALALQKRFFDHFLKGENNGWDREPPVSVAIRRPGGISWRKEAAWPLPGTEWEHYYLDAADGAMSIAKGVPAAAECSYPAMGDGVTFQTAPFPEEVEFTGPLKLKLWVRSTTADMDIFATVWLIDPEGRDVTFTGGTEPRVPATQGSLQVSFTEIGSNEVGSNENGFAQIAFAEVGSAQIAFAQISFTEVGSIDYDPINKNGVSETGFSQIGEREAGSVQVGSIEVSSQENGFEGDSFA